MSSPSALSRLPSAKPANSQSPSGSLRTRASLPTRRRSLLGRLPEMLHSPPRLSRSSQPIRVSFEFFPPKTEEMEKTLWEAIGRLAPLAPSLVSGTYGAGGSTRERTHATVARLVEETALQPAAHLTCVGASRAEIDAVIQD